MGIPSVFAEGVMTKRRLESDPLGPALACGASYRYKTRDGQGNLVRAVAGWLQDMVRHYDGQEWVISADRLRRTDTFPVSVFHGRPLSWSIEDFISRICSGAKLDDTVVLVAAVYLSRVIEKAGGKLPVSSCTVHRLMLQAITLASKFMLDHPRSNKVMASFADLAIGKFNELEVKFLCAIQYELAVSPEDIELAEGALQIVRVPCDKACEIKKRKVDVLQDYSNQSSAVGGVAACNNSVEWEGVKKVDNNSTENGAANNYNKVNVPGPTDLVASVCLEASNNYAQEIASTLYPKSHKASCQPPNDIAQSTVNTSDIKDIECNLSRMPPQPTKMSTPERRGSYTLIATAAE